MVRRPLYQLTDIENFEYMFSHTDHVVVAAGVNDLSRYGHRGYSLGEAMEPILERLLARHPTTTFTLCGPLLTALPWLNREIDVWTERLFHLSNLPHMHNLLLLDMAHEGELYWQSVGDPLEVGGNGIHISFGAKRAFREIIKDNGAEDEEMGS